MPGPRAGIRVLLATQLAGIAAAAVAVLAALGPLLLARPTPARLLALAGILAAAIFASGALLLGRAVARPVDRMLAAAERLAGSGRGLPVLGEGDAPPPGLGRAAVAFERTAAALDEERRALSAKVDELTRANAALAAARESLARSERLATVGRLAAGVAHEVGNPLGAIGGFAELARTRLEAGAPGAEVADFLARISAETGRIDAIVRDLLDFARPSHLDVAPVGVAAALDAALRLARVQARFRDVRVEVELPEALPPVLADERRLAQVFLNLLLNAGDAMNGRGVVRVAATRADGRVDVRVADGGSGIPEADRARVFEPFFTTKAPGQGTGLGLAVCHGIVESFGGTIAAEHPEAGEGAVFRIGLRTA
jgi:two-component system, NtrC family, sensor kinase